MNLSLYKLFAKRYKATIGYNLFYGVLLAAVSFGVVSILKRYAPYFSFNVPDFFYSDATGVTLIYACVSLALITISMVFVPSALCLDEISNNRWYLLAKLGMSIKSAVLNRLIVGICPAIISFLFGLILILALGSFVLFSFSGAAISSIIKLIIISILFIIDLLLIPMAISTSIPRKWTTSIFVLLVGCGLFYLVVSAFPFATIAETTVADAVNAGINNLLSLNPTGILLITVLILAIFLLWLFLNASRRTKSYADDELDEDVLSALGVENDVLVLERGSHKYNIVISGPEIHGESNFKIKIPEPPLDEDEPSDEAEEQE